MYELCGAWDAAPDTGTSGNPRHGLRTRQQSLVKFILAQDEFQELSIEKDGERASFRRVYVDSVGLLRAVARRALLVCKCGLMPCKSLAILASM